jgi:3'-phosphoadenosine 5'-phosphosulfate sulfotransferase (PAPS reductase)/FAD synthetase
MPLLAGGKIMKSKRLWKGNNINKYVIETNMIASYPLSIWTENNVWAYIRKFNLPYSPIYDMGLKRTGRMFCIILIVNTLSKRLGFLRFWLPSDKRQAFLFPERNETENL